MILTTTKKPKTLSQGMCGIRTFPLNLTRAYMKLLINVFILLLPIALHAGSSFSRQERPNTVKLMVEILKKTDPNNNLNNGPLETLAYAYNTYNENTHFGTQQKQSSDDMKYSIPVFLCCASNVGGVKTYHINFEAMYNPAPRPEEAIEEDLDTLIEGDLDERLKRSIEDSKRGNIALKAFDTPIAKDSREFSLNESQTYQTSDPAIIVKAGAYSINQQ